jgi:hypothetical protein
MLLHQKFDTPNGVEGWALERSELGLKFALEDVEDVEDRSVGLKFCSVCSVLEIHLEVNGTADNKNIKVLSQPGCQALICPCCSEAESHPMLWRY